MTQTFPLLPLRDIVVFPGMVVPLFVGRDKSVAALEAAMEGSKDIFLLAQLDPGCDDPEADDLFDVGVIAQVLQLLKLPDGTVRVLVQGTSRASLEQLAPRGDHVEATVTAQDEVTASGSEVTAMMRQVVEQFGEYVRHAGEEYVYVVKGSIVVHTEFYDPVTLCEGQSIYIDASMGHAYVTADDCAEAVVLGVMSSPDDELMQELLKIHNDQVNANKNSPVGGRKKP